MPALAQASSFSPPGAPETPTAPITSFPTLIGTPPPTATTARLEALLTANAALRCGARSKRTGKACQGAAMPNGRCKLHGGKSTGPRTPEGLERSRRANWKHGHFSREAKAWRSRVRAALLALRYLRMLVISLNREMLMSARGGN